MWVYVWINGFGYLMVWCGVLMGVDCEDVGVDHEDV